MSASIVTSTITGTDVPQYAHFLPKYLPRYGINTNVNMSSSCCRLSLHSRSASEYASSSLGDTEVVEPADEEGKESTSSSGSGILAYEDDGSDILVAVMAVTGADLTRVLRDQRNVVRMALEMM